MSVKKIAIISTSSASPWGGSEELWLAIAEQAIQENIVVLVSVYKWPLVPAKIERIIAKGVNVFFRKRINYPDMKGKIIGKVNQILFAENQLNRFANVNKPDFLIISMGAFCELEVDPVRKFLLKLKMPYFLIIHSNTETHTVSVFKMDEIQSICRNASKIFFVSKRILEQAERQIAIKFNSADIAINPLNIEKIGVLPFPNQDVVEFACVGTLLVKVKGQAMLLQLLSSDKWKSRNWRLNIYGKGTDETLLIKLIDSFGLKDRVLLHGFTNNIIDDIWARNHLLLMPSYIEGMPIALLEAMLCGRTAVVTDVGGNRELIINGVNGFIAEAPTTYSFDKALEQAWIKQNEWKAFGVAAFETAKKYYGKNPAKSILNKMLNTTINE